MTTTKEQETPTPPKRKRRGMVTNTVTIPLQAQLIDDRVLIVGSTDIVFADYGITTPAAPIVHSVADQGTLEIQLWLARA